MNMRHQLPEQWPPYGMGIPFAFGRPKSEDSRFFTTPGLSIRGMVGVETVFRDRGGEEYVHTKSYPAENMREAIYRHRCWLSGANT